MEDLTNIMRREAERVAATVAQTRMGIVSGYDPNRYAAKVKLQPEGHETGWIPIMSPAVGNGFGITAPPALGDEVVVAFQEGNAEAGVVIGSVFNDEDRVPVEGIGGTPGAEMRIVSKSGARIRLMEDGTVEIRKEAGTLVRLNADGTVDIHGPTVRVGADGSLFRGLLMDTFITFFNQHNHGGAPPVTPLTTAYFTTALKGA